MGYECFHCGNNTVSWDNDFTFEDLGYLGEGLVHMLHCDNCGAIIEYRLEEDDEDAQ